MAMITVLLADDDPAVHEAVAALLASAADIRVIGHARDGASAAAMAAELRPDVALLDVKMPGTDGLAAADRIRRETPGCAVVMLTGFDDDANLDRALAIGVSGFLLKTARPGELLNGVRTAAAGGVCITGTVLRRLGRRALQNRPARLPQQRLATLTPRERELLELISQGRTNQEIAAMLHLTEGTVKGYVSTVFTKIDARNRVEAAYIAFQASSSTEHLG